MLTDALIKQEERITKETEKYIETLESMIGERRDDYLKDLQDNEKNFAEILESYNAAKEDIKKTYLEDTKDLRFQISAKKVMLQGGRINTKKVLKAVLEAKDSTIFTIEEIAENAIEMGKLNEAQKPKFIKALPATIAAIFKKGETWLEKHDGKTGPEYSLCAEEEEEE